MILPKYKAPTEDGDNFIVGLPELSAFNAHYTEECVIKEMRNHAFELNKQFENKKVPISGNMLLRAENGLGKMFYYEVFVEINLQYLTAKVVPITVYETLKDFKIAYRKKAEEMEEAEKRSKEKEKPE